MDGTHSVEMDEFEIGKLNQLNFKCFMSSSLPSMFDDKFSILQLAKLRSQMSNAIVYNWMLLCLLACNMGSAVDIISS